MGLRLEYEKESNFGNAFIIRTTVRHIICYLYVQCQPRTIQLYRYNNHRTDLLACGDDTFNHKPKEQNNK